MPTVTKEGKAVEEKKNGVVEAQVNTGAAQKQGAAINRKNTGWLMKEGRYHPQKNTPQTSHLLVEKRHFALCRTLESTRIDGKYNKRGEITSKVEKGESVGSWWRYLLRA